MGKPIISEQVITQVEEIVADFNRKIIRDPNRYYVTRYRGRYLYLDRRDHGFVSQVCRLEYTGSIDKWRFAIFKYSSLRYDPDEWIFPGGEYVDGTVVGAMRAGIDAYP
jgi:hypothetical protein